MSKNNPKLTGFVTVIAAVRSLDLEEIEKELNEFVDSVQYEGYTYFANKEGEAGLRVTLNHFKLIQEACNYHEEAGFLYKKKVDEERMGQAGKGNDDEL